MDGRALVTRAGMTWLAVAVACGLLVGVAFGAIVHPGVDGATSGSTAPDDGEVVLGLPGDQPSGAPDEPSPQRAEASSGPDAAAADAVNRALARQLTAGAASVGDGTVEAAVMVDGSAEPAVVGDASRRMRTWSMVKLVTALTLIEVRGGEIGDVEPIVERALRQSDNCAQRKLVLELQQALGSEAAVKGAVVATVARAGAGLDVDLAQRGPDGRHCIAPGYAGLSAEDAELPALLLGTTEWGVADAVRVAHALRDGGAYGGATSDYLLGLLRAPKSNSGEPGAGDLLTASPSWGAGEIFAGSCWNLAYKAGWGGSANQSYLAGQLGAVDLPDGRWAAFAIMFHPAAQPGDDDPGKAGAALAVETVLSALERGLREQLGADCP